MFAFFTKDRVKTFLGIYQNLFYALVSPFIDDCSHPAESHQFTLFISAAAVDLQPKQKKNMLKSYFQ